LPAKSYNLQSKDIQNNRACKHAPTALRYHAEAQRSRLEPPAPAPLAQRASLRLEANLANRNLRPPALLLIMIGMIAPGLLRAQSEDELAQYFVGRTVAVKMDMPATKEGVDVYPERSPDIDYNEYSQRLKRYGISLHSGDAAQITKIKVKDKLVEFHLGGGGYGTAGDETNSAVSLTPTPKSAREKELEREIKSATDKKQKRRLQERLDDLQRDREREDARLKVVAALAEEQRRQRILLRALQSGSRFNLRYPEGVVIEKLTPDVVMQALAEKVDFTPPAPQFAQPAGSPGGLYKGMTEDEVDALLGRPVEVRHGTEGSLDVSRCTYHQGETIVEALFVEGVLVRYTISSR
jgi:hypothetical protein